MEFTKIAVLGGGTMGGGIIQVVASAGYSVILKDIEDRFVQQGLETAHRNLQIAVKRRRISEEEMTACMGRIHGSTSYEGFEDVDLVIEAVPEIMKIKKQVYRELEAVCPPRSIFCSNTSSLSITEMAASTRRPQKFIGMHFFNPAPVMKLVEVITALQTDQETTDAAVDLARRMGKVPVRVLECAGFLVNRILIPWMHEAIRALSEGAAEASAIDKAMTQAGYPMAPFVLIDLVGIDIALNVAQVLYEAYGPRHAVPLLLKRLVEKGRYGKKAGKGIYANGVLDEEMLGLIADVQRETGVRTAEFSPERLILQEVNEAVYCLQEGVATAEEIDHAMVLGTNFPHDRTTGIGGPLHWADEKGLDWVLERLEYYRGALGDRFWPHPMLKRYVAAGWLGRKAGRGFFVY